MNTERFLVALLFLTLGVGGFILIHNAVTSATLGTYTAKDLSSSFLPVVEWIWLTCFLSLSAYVGVKSK